MGVELIACLLVERREFTSSPLTRRLVGAFLDAARGAPLKT